MIPPSKYTTVGPVFPVGAHPTQASWTMRRPLKLPNLPEVRVVDLEVVAEGLADVAVDLDPRTPDEDVVARALAVRGAVLVQQGLGLDEDRQVHRGAFHGQRDVHGA